MLYCPPNVTFDHIWVNHGISHCFLDTVTSAVYAAFILLFGTGQWVMYRKYATVTDQYLRPKSVLFGMQVFLTVLMLFIAIARLTLQATVIGDHVIYGYMILYFCCNVICWPLSLRIVFLERNYLLPTVPTRGHGVVLLVFWTLVFVSENLAFLNLRNEDWWFDLTTLTDKMEFVLFLLRYVSGCLLFILGLKSPGISTLRDYVNFGGTLNDQEENNAQSENRNNSAGSTWRNVWKKLRLLMPFIWPKKSVLLQLNVIFCIILLLIGRVANLFVPIYYKMIVDGLGGSGGTPYFCWDYVLIYSALKFLQGGGTGGMGLLNNARTLLWISVQQYTSREVQLQLFSHLHNLSLRWHLGRKTGEVLRVMDRGTNSINSLLSYIVFNIAPTVIDIIVAIVYFTTAFNYWFGIIVFVTMAIYLGFTIGLTEWRTKFRRKMNLADNEQRTRGVDSLLNFETVKYYGAEEYEVNRYRESVLEYQSEEWKSNASLCFLNTIQNVVINGGLLTGSMLAAWMVANDKGLTVGDYVLFATYIMQLYTPLNWFGTYYRMIQQNFIDMENMFDLLEEKEEVLDKEDAQLLLVPQGRIEFKDVSFHYSPERPILKNISFVAEPGQTIAIVGPTGSGKSTIMRLIFRFYDVISGAVFVDNLDIRDYKQNSLRQAIGVVPQDTVLFNETIFYNIHYGKVTAPDADVKEAAKHADIHEKILTFSEQYDTKVGERGLKLSGGEKQRVAIARTILKNPAFILLDEATSALDTQTERNIQAALQKVCKERTTVVVAHRLSTVINADVILVLKDGDIIERGRHEELLGMGGVYSNMWQQQLEANNNAESSMSTEEGATAVDEANLEPPKVIVQTGVRIPLGLRNIDHEGT
ncbi:ATP-binding cassette sub-family B member 6-like [Macrobrachium nipponense]|uniref:ATP-binding cassette sub-family B member 6-like n=1 Tax=Macrobrachium nipponense TaxID=159736 RepID=UPI0030C88132